MRPCPYCGKSDDEHTLSEQCGTKSLITLIFSSSDDDLPGWTVRCRWCGSCGPEAETKEKAVKRWEERAWGT